MKIKKWNKFKKMAKLILKDVKIELPKDFKEDFNDAQFVEWLEYEFGACSSIAISNPLHKLELKDCNVQAGSATIDGKNVVI